MNSKLDWMTSRGHSQYSLFRDLYKSRKHNTVKEQMLQVKELVNVVKSQEETAGDLQAKR